MTPFRLLAVTSIVTVPLWGLLAPRDAFAKPPPPAPPPTARTAAPELPVVTSSPATLEQAASPQEIVVPVATTAPPPPPPPSAPSPPPPVFLGAVGLGPLAPSVYGVRSGGTSRTGVGLSVLSVTARGWYLPAAGQDGLVARGGGSLAIAEGTLDTSANAIAWPIEGLLAIGYRWAIGGQHHLQALAGFRGLVRASIENGEATQSQRGYLHLPDLNVGYQWHARDLLVEIGPGGGLAVVGQNSVVFDGHTARTGTGTYTLRPAGGGQIAVLTSTVLASIAAHRTWLSGGAGRVDERVLGLVCHALSTRRNRGSFGGCVSADVSRARGGDAAGVWGYEVTFAIGTGEFAD